MIRLKEYNKDEQKISFISDMPIGLANAIRRSVLDIPIMAIDEVEFIKNDSALYDEIIAHRLGLVPIKTEKTSREIKFKLKEQGPKTIYSTDLSPDTGTNLKLPIVILDQNQELEIVAEARLGKGSEHVKYSPGLLYYKSNLDDDILEFVHVDREGKVNYDEEELKRKNVPDEKIKEIKKLNKINEIIMYIESWGQLEVRDVFLKAIKALSDNLKELDKAVK
ncbi:hypothetical protein GF386_03200 [Candidatus Pacearchaeota archaeon]|nr:hypothetical protein [Candidatus Pacearchaeota archaeon]